MSLTEAVLVTVNCGLLFWIGYLYYQLGRKHELLLDFIEQAQMSTRLTRHAITLLREARVKHPDLEDIGEEFDSSSDLWESVVDDA